MSLVHSFPTEDMYEPQYLDSFQHIAGEDSPVEVATPPPKSKLIRGRQKRTTQNVKAPLECSSTLESSSSELSPYVSSYDESSSSDESGCLEKSDEEEIYEEYDEINEEAEDGKDDSDDELWSPKTTGTTAKNLISPKMKGARNNKTWEMIVNKEFGVKKEKVKDQVKESKEQVKKDIIGGVIGWETEMTDVEVSNGKIMKTLADKLLNYIITHEVKEMFYVKLQNARVHYDGEDPPMIYINENIGSKLGILGANEDMDGSLIMTKVIKGEFEKIKDVKVKDVSLACDTPLEVFNNDVSRLRGMDDDLFTYEVEVANIPCDSKIVTNTSAHVMP
ncbi:hypothetical protein Tco_0751980 [Tanacetum coccineum]|uniref:Uncharacterized protein n=1 Tax=Tanacetum coccineum TaxID=301880 RepID=A0ABQ4Z5M6_9ASTR